MTGQIPFAKRRVALACAAAALILVPFAILVLLVTAASSPLIRADHRVTNSLHDFAVTHPNFTALMKGVSTVGGPVGWWVVLSALFGWLLYRRRARLAAFVAVTALGSAVLNHLVKSAVDRARPHLSDPVAMAAGKSFPSGHAQATTVGCGILLVIFLPMVSRPHRLWLWVAAGVVVTAVAFSRVALGVHFVSDVIGGVILGAAWVLAMAAAFDAWPTRTGAGPPVRRDLTDA